VSAWAEMTPERESALDHLLDPDLWLPAGVRGENVDYAECPPRERVERARAELSSLHAKIGALEEALWRFHEATRYAETESESDSAAINKVWVESRHLLFRGGRFCLCKMCRP